MSELNPKYIVAVAEQLSFVSAFLGGISATILGPAYLCCTLLQQSVCHLDTATVCRSSGLNQKQSTQYK